MKEKISEYLRLDLSEINERIEKNGEVLDRIWREDDGKSWDRYCEKCQAYWDDNTVLYAVQSIKIPRGEAEMRPLKEDEKDDEWRHIKIETFIEWCESGFVTSYDGDGFYATEDEVSDLAVSTWGIKNGLVRSDFSYVCWYNK